MEKPTATEKDNISQTLYKLSDARKVIIKLEYEEEKIGTNHIHGKGRGNFYDTKEKKPGTEEYHFKIFNSKFPEEESKFLSKNLSILDSKDPARPDLDFSDHFAEYPEIIPYMVGNCKYIFVVSKLYSEGSVQDQLVKRKKLSTPELLEFTRHMIEGLIHCHHRGLVLRGLTPDHIFIEKYTDPNGAVRSRYKIGGLEYLESYKGELERKAYVSSLDERFVDPWWCGGFYWPCSDVYILGLVIYYAATGEMLTKSDITGNKWQQDIECTTIRNVLRVFLNTEKRCDLPDIIRVYNAAFKGRRYREDKDHPIHVSNVAKISWVIDEYTGEEAVAKIFYLSDPDAKEVYEKERKNWEALSSLPFVVPLLDAQVLLSNKNGEEVKKAILITEKYKGDFKSLLNNELWYRHLKFEEIVRAAWELGQALYGIHFQGFIHRDVKPENTYAKVDGKIGEYVVLGLLLGDFGITKEGSTDTENIGTPGYKAPEIMLRGEYSSKVDVWGYGLVIFYAMFKATPYDFLPEGSPEKAKCMKEGKIDWEMFEKQYSENIAPAKGESEVMGKLLFQFLKRCLVPEPNERATMKELLKDELFRDRVKMVIPTRPSCAPYMVSSDSNKFIKRCNLNGINYGFIDELLNAKDMEKRYKFSAEPAKVLEQYYKALSVWSNINKSECDRYNIAHLHECFIVENVGLSIVTDPFDSTLKEYINKCKGLKPKELIEFSRDIINGIAYLHSINLCHRGIRPENVYVLPKRVQKGENKRTEAKLGGFNYARVVLDHKLTLQGINYYDAPEVRRNIGLKEQEERVEGEALKKLDIWSYGAVLFYMLFGMDLEEYPKVIEQIEKGELVTNVGDVKNKFLLSIMQECLVQDPSKRPTAAALLEKFQKEYPSLFPKTSTK